MKRARLDDGAGDDFDQRPFGVGAGDRPFVLGTLVGNRRRQLNDFDLLAWIDSIVDGSIGAVALGLPRSK